MFNYKLISNLGMGWLSVQTDQVGVSIGLIWLPKFIHILIYM